MKEQVKNTDSLYIQQLEFRKEDGQTWLSFFVHRFRVVLMIIGILFVWGYSSLMALPLESMPEVEIPVGFVSVALPGASPKDVEELVIKKLEPALVNLSGVETVNATAINSVGQISVQFYADEDLKDAISRLREAVDSAKGDLPAEALDPIVRQVELTDFPIWTLVVTGPYDNFTLREYADKVAEELENLPGTSKISVNGGDTAEIRVSYDPQKLQTYNLSADQINGIIAASNLALPLGSIEISDFNYSVRAERQFVTAAELRALPVAYINGRIIRLAEVADVVERAQDRDVFSYLSLEGGEMENAITINVNKKTGFSIIELIDSGKEKMELLKESSLPKDLNIVSTLDSSQEVRKTISDLMDSGMMTLVLVVVTLFIFVGLKEALVAGLAIPMVFAASFGVMNLMGISLNFLSLFSLILSLGILVDNAIVVLQASKQYIRTGKFTPEEAILLVFRDFKYILTSTTLTTVWAFLPLVLATGIIGQFIISIPITVTSTLIASLFVAFFVNHPLVVALERLRITRTGFKVFMLILIVALGFTIYSLLIPGFEVFESIVLLILGTLIFSLYFYYRAKLKEKLIMNEDLLLQEAACPQKIRQRLQKKYSEENIQGNFWKRLYTGIIHLDAFLPLYEKIMRFLFRSKTAAFVFLLLIFLGFTASAALPATGILKPEFLPQSDYEYMYINIEGPPGMITDRTKEIAFQVSDLLRDEKAIANFSLIVGNSGVSRSSFQTVGASNSNRAQIAIMLHDIKERAAKEGLEKPTKSYELATKLRKKITSVKGAKIEVVEVSGGPPSGADFEATLSGDNLEELETLARKYKDLLSEIPGTVNESTSISLNPGEFTFHLDYNEMVMRGLTVAQVASTLRTAVSGSEVTKIYGDGDNMRVLAEFQQEKIPTINALENLNLSNGRGQLYRLGDIAEVEIGSSLTAISRRDQTRIVGISAEVEDPILPVEVLDNFKKIVEENPLPKGYEFDFGGANKQTEESILSIFNAMLVAVLLILITLIIQLNSFRKTLIVMMTIPLATMGVFFGLWLAGLNLSFPVLIGVLALFGIVINNSIILVEKISQNLLTGIEFADAIIDAAKMRLEAIFLTSICTIIGMIPLALSNDTWGGLGISLIFGLSASTFLTLLTIPVLYFLIMKKSSLRDARIRELKRMNECL